MSDMLLTFNAGSSSVKIGLFEVAGRAARRVARGTIDFRADPLVFRLEEGPETFTVDLGATGSVEFIEVIEQTFDWLAHHFDLARIAVAGHRVVHGGDEFAGPARLTPEAVARIEGLATLAPLHQPQSLRLIRAIGKLRPDLVQTASFDTAFHLTNAPVVRRFAIPRELHDQGVKRYGFHGLSYRYIAGALARDWPEVARGRVVVLHLGSGASLCAMEGGLSRDTSMGFSTLDGIPMATRCGALDPGVILHLTGPLGWPEAELEKLLYYRSGMLGVSGISADTRVLLDSAEPAAAEAIELLEHRIAGEVARLAATLGGLDALVFTAGIGENQPRIRADVMRRLAWLGVVADEAANAGRGPLVSAPQSAVTALMLATDEEQVIADEALSLAGA